PSRCVERGTPRRRARTRDRPGGGRALPAPRAPGARARTRSRLCSCCSSPDRLAVERTNGPGDPVGVVCVLLGGVEAVRFGGLTDLVFRCAGPSGEDALPLR